MSETKSALQMEARAAWRRGGSKGTLAAATGVGKTKPAIDEMMEIWQGWKSTLTPEDIIDGPALTPPEFLVAVPTETLRDTGWPDEVRLWHGDEGMEMWEACVTAVCYIAMHKLRGGYYSLVILDEGHHITSLNAMFFDQNVVMAIMVLTATFPSEKNEGFKFYLLHKLAPVCFTYPLEQGVEDGLIADFELRVVLCTLDGHTKNIKSGPAAKPFMTTERKYYDYLTKAINKKYVEQNLELPQGAKPLTDTQRAAIQKSIDFLTLKRAQFLYNLSSKTKLAKAVIHTEWGDQASYQKGRPRTLVFCGSIKQCEELCGAQVYHSKSPSLALEAFMEEDISLLGCVNSLNEGINVPNLEQSIIVQASSNPRDMVQRVGRNVRWREGGGVRKVWILCAQDTQDESWVKNALASFSPERIKYLSSRTYGV